MSGRLRLPLMAGPPPGRRKDGNKGKPSKRSRLLLRELFGFDIREGAVSGWLVPATETLRKWVKEGYIAPSNGRYILTAKGKERAR